MFLPPTPSDVLLVKMLCSRAMGLQRAQLGARLCDVGGQRLAPGAGSSALSRWQTFFFLSFPPWRVVSDLSRVVQLRGGGPARLLVALCGHRDGAGDAGVVAGGHGGHLPRSCCSFLPSPRFGGAPVPPQPHHRGSCLAQAIHLTPPWADPAAQLRFVLPRVQPNLSSSSVSLQPPPKAAGSWITGAGGGPGRKHPTISTRCAPIKPSSTTTSRPSCWLCDRPGGLQQSPEQRVAPGESSTP